MTSLFEMVRPIVLGGVGSNHQQEGCSQLFLVLWVLGLTQVAESEDWLQSKCILKE